MRKLSANSHSSGPTATAAVVDSTSQALLMANRQSQLRLGRCIGPKLVGHRQSAGKALLLAVCA